jgi:[glutamine synthetase] adenylyltransferase / [glutamine synthetase]-adenylyl-L-tyrosine phosphorylase
MSFAEDHIWLPPLTAGNEKDLAPITAAAGFSEPGKTAANLVLLNAALGDPEQVITLAQRALQTADPDLALNTLERLSGTADTPVLKGVLADETALSQLLTLLGASPFLAGILCRRPALLSDLFAKDQINSAKSETQMGHDLGQLIADDADTETLKKGLRLYKAQEILRIGARDLCGLASLEEVTAELSALAAAALQRAFEVCSQLLQNEFGRPLLEAAPGETPQQAEFTILGMGKFGGCELNFSSDIDLIYFYSSDRGQTAGVEDASGQRRNRITLHQYFVRLAEMISRAIGKATEDGFVFRVDLRLRPEGNSGELANSLPAAEIYYESWGQSWERSAMLKARPVAGSKQLGEQLLTRLEPFIYRRHLDYAMIDDIRTMKQKIDRSLSREKEGELNLKLGRGGIREIEFFIQALQLINAGKKPRLRERNSLKALALLYEEGLITANERDHLSAAYRFLRTVEHRIQVVHEQQTHNLPVRPEELTALARRCDFADSASFMAALESHRERVSAVFRDLFYTSEEELPAQVQPEVAFLFDANADRDHCLDILEAKGFRPPEPAFESLTVLRKGGTKGYLTERARRRLDRIAPLLFQEVLHCPDPPMALTNMEKFLEACRRARGTYYALLAENPEIIKVLVSLFATSQFLSRNFIQHPEVLDSLVSRSYAKMIKEPEDLTRELAGLLKDASYYEDKLNTLRRFRNEEFLRIALNDIHGHIPQGQTTRQLSLVADSCLQQALEIAREELLERYGRPFCEDASGASHETEFIIVGLGKLGGMELNYHSDLDIIFVHEGEGATRPVAGTDSARFKEQTNQQYFARLAQRVISVLTLMTREGHVYEIDTRLRPSGNQGPLVSSLPAYRQYHQDTAAPWERQALIKARVVAGSAKLAADFDALTAEIVYKRPLPDNLTEEILRLRQRMEKELGKEDAEHRNIKTGRGGMVDVEFIAQYLQLRHGGEKVALRRRNTLEALDELSREGFLTEADHKNLKSGYKFLRRLENKLRLVHDQSVNELTSDPAYLAKLAKHLGYPEGQPGRRLLEEYLTTTQAIRDIFDRIFNASAA